MVSKIKTKGNFFISLQISVYLINCLQGTSIKPKHKSLNKKNIKEFNKIESKTANKNQNLKVLTIFTFNKNTKHLQKNFMINSNGLSITKSFDYIKTTFNSPYINQFL